MTYLSLDGKEITLSPEEEREFYTSTKTTTGSGLTHWKTPSGLLHRTDGPAIIRPEGDEIWYQYDQIHRGDGGPAVTWSDGTKFWYHHGKIHREDGPAVIWGITGHLEWAIDDVKYPFNVWADKLNLDKKTRLELVMKWNPD